MKNLLFLVLIAITLQGCDTGLRQMGATERAVVFRRLPPVFGGGVSPKIVDSAQKVVVWPWDTLYRFDTSEKYVSWGEGKGKKTDADRGVVYTRALDGNEVALSVTVVYQIDPDPSKLIRLVQEAATDDEEVEDLVVAVGRADIRTHMNALRTAQFADSGERYGALNEVRRSMNERLGHYGIDVLKVTLDDFQFERLLRDGTVDSSYQEKLTQIQKLKEDRGREMSRIQTVKARKEKEYNDVQAVVNQKTQEAQGFLNQATFRADGYYTVKSNESEGILAKGRAEVTGLIQQIDALSGPGGQQILKLELARELVKSNPKFMVVNDDSGKANGLDVRRTDINQLLSQLGMIEGLKEKSGTVTTPPESGKK